jgi:hypothetical protein
MMEMERMRMKVNLEKFYARKIREYQQEVANQEHLRDAK